MKNSELLGYIMAFQALILFITTLSNCRYPTEEKDNSIYIDWTDEISASFEYGRYDIYNNVELYAEFEVIRGMSYTLKNI